MHSLTGASDGIRGIIPKTAVAHLDRRHRAGRRAAAFRGAARVEEKETAVASGLGEMGVAVDDYVAAREERGEPRLPAESSPRLVDHADAVTGQLDDPPT